MLVLGIETSSSVGSVALLAAGRPLAKASHDTPNAHGERLLSLVDQLFETTGRSRSELGLIAVGRGPGTFTGLRVGLSMAQGMAVGLGIPAAGVGSLQAMAKGLDFAQLTEDGSPNLALIPRLTVADARRGELFVGCYAADGRNLFGPRAWDRTRLVELIGGELAPILQEPNGPMPGRCVVLGAVLGQLSREELDLDALSALGATSFRSPETDHPSALAVAHLAHEGQYVAPPTPEYLRDADAILPSLPPNPMTLPPH